MRTHKTIVFLVSLVEAVAGDIAQSPSEQERERPAVRREEKQPINPSRVVYATPDPLPSQLLSATNDLEGLRPNFRDAPVEVVLDYLRNAGFHVVLEASATGTVTAWSRRLLTKEETVGLLTTALEESGYSVIRNGQSLTVEARDESKRLRSQTQSAIADPVARSINQEKRPINITAPTLRELAAQLSSIYGTVVCSESSASDTNREPKAFSLVVDSATLSEALDRFAASRREYLWQRDEATGFVNVFPKRGALLDLRIESISISNKTVAWIFNNADPQEEGTLSRLLTSRGITVVAKAFSPPMYPTRGSPGHVAGVQLALRTDSSSLNVKVSLELRDATIRQVISRICAEVPSKRWDLEDTGDKRGNLWFYFVRPKP